MSPLWKKIWNAQTNDTFYQKPSPTKTNLSCCFIGNFISNQSNNRHRNGQTDDCHAEDWHADCQHTENRHTSIEGTPLFAFLQKKVSAGMTVEAAMVLPLFLFFFFNLSCALEMIRLRGNLELALWETGSRFSIYGPILLAEASPEQTADGGKNLGGGGIWAEIGDMALSGLYAKRAVIKYAGEDYLKQSPLTKGADGLQFMESEIFTSGDCFELNMTYEVSTWAQMPGIRPFRMWNRYYGHFWNGYGIPDDAGVTVYVAENGSVYHRKRECTYLVLRIREVAGWQVEYERSENGNKYYLCEKCGEGDRPVTVFVAAEGERFHYRRDCSGLRRTVFSLFLKEAGAYRPCSRCSGGG